MIPLRVLLDVEADPIVKQDEMVYENILPLNIVGILPDGTEEGKPVVILRMDRPDGKAIIAQTSLKALQGAMRIITAKYGEISDDMIYGAQI